MAGKTINEIAALLGDEVVGDGSIVVSRVKDINEAGQGDIAFILHPKFSGLLDKANPSCAVVPPQIKEAKCTIIRSENPQLAFRKIVDILKLQPSCYPKGIHKTAVIGKNVILGKGIGIGANCVIEDGATIGDRTVLYPLTYIGHKSTIGEDCVIYPNVSIRENIKIGSRVIIHSGTAIGSDGFGYDSSTGVHLKIPQIGNVIIGDDVEIGASVTIDRAKFAHTVIGDGTKIDNLVQIAHNVKTGKHCIIVAQCGISGSTKLGNYVIMGGQSGVTDHVEIGDQAMIGAQAGVTKSIPPKSILWGTPAIPLRRQKEALVLFRKLPEIHKRLRAIEKTLKTK